MPKIRNTDRNLRIGASLRNLRHINGLTLQNLADILGISYQQVQKYEAGTNALPLAFLPVLADFFGVSADYFFQDMSASTLSSDDDILSLCLSIAAVPDPVTRHKIRRVVEIMAA